MHLLPLRCPMKREIGTWLIAKHIVDGYKRLQIYGSPDDLEIKSANIIKASYDFCAL